jgi:hypothetical protein
MLSHAESKCDVESYELEMKHLSFYCSRVGANQSHTKRKHAQLTNLRIIDWLVHVTDVDEALINLAKQL